jgi:hypothetical protein
MEVGMKKDEQGAPATDAEQLTHAPGEDGPPISPLDPSSMPRGEDDAETMANSPEFHDVPGSGKDLLKPKK